MPDPIYFVTEAQVDPDLPIHALDDLVEVLNGYGEVTEKRVDGDRIVGFQFSSADIDFSNKVGDSWAAAPTAHLTSASTAPLAEEYVIGITSTYASLVSYWGGIAQEAEALGFTFKTPYALPF